MPETESTQPAQSTQPVLCAWCDRAAEPNDGLYAWKINPTVLAMLAGPEAVQRQSEADPLVLHGECEAEFSEALLIEGTQP